MLEQCRGFGGVGRNLRGSSGHAQVEGRPQSKGRNFRIHLVMVPPQSFGTYRPGSAQCLVLSAVCVCVLAHTGLARLSAWC